MPTFIARCLTSVGAVVLTGGSLGIIAGEIANHWDKQSVQVGIGAAGGLLIGYVLGRYDGRSR